MIINHDNLGEVRERSPESQIGLRFGCYDLLHEGHFEGLNFSKEQADVLVVGVLPDSLVSKRKGPERPINGERDRVKTIDQIETVDYSFVVPESLLDCAKSMIKLQPDVYVEHIEHASRPATRLFLGLLGSKCVIDQKPKINSTTLMLERINNSVLQAS